MTQKNNTDFVTKKELEITLQETLEVFSRDLLSGISVMLDAMKQDIKKELTEELTESLTADAEKRHEETRRHFDIVAEDMFESLKGANADELNANTHKLKIHEETLNHHDARLNRLELLSA